MVSCVFALEAPYLVSVQALTDSSISYSWRNNDINSNGYVIYQKAISNTSFKEVNTADKYNFSAQHSGLVASTKYYLAVKAYNGTDTSILSNIDSVITKDIQKIFKQPTISAAWDLPARKIVLRVYDSSNCETGIRISLSEQFQPYQLKETLLSSNPQTTGLITWKTADIRLNTWYAINVVAYNATDSIASSIDTLYTFDAQNLIDKNPRMYLKEKISDFPIKLKGWAMKNGNSILLTETNAPESSFTILDVSDNTKPVFKGYKKSAQSIFSSSAIIKARLKSLYDWKNLPYSIKYYTRGNNLISCNDTSISMYGYNDSDFTLKYSKIQSWGKGNNLRFSGLQKGLKDSTLIIWSSNTSEMTTTCGEQFFSEIKLYQDSISDLLVTVKNDTIVIGQRNSILTSYLFTFTKSIGATDNCFNYYGGIYFFNNKLIYQIPRWMDIPFRISILDYSFSYAKPLIIGFYGLKGQYDASSAPNGDSLSDFVYNDANKFAPIQYVGNYILNDSLFPAINFSFIDSTNQTVFFVFDTYLSIYKYDTVPPQQSTQYGPATQKNKGVLNNALISSYQTGEYLNMSFSCPFKILNLEIYNTRGQLIKNETFTNGCLVKANLNRLTNGIYFYSANVDGKRIINKFRKL